MSPSEGSYFGFDILIAIMRGIDSVTDASEYMNSRQPKKTHIRKVVG